MWTDEGRESTGGNAEGGLTRRCGGAERGPGWIAHTMPRRRDGPFEISDWRWAMASGPGWSGGATSAVADRCVARGGSFIRCLFLFIIFTRLTVAQVFWGKGQGKNRLRESARVCASLRESACQNRVILLHKKVDGNWEPRVGRWEPKYRKRANRAGSGRTVNRAAELRI
jgi:hypothetical protein